MNKYVFIVLLISILSAQALIIYNNENEVIYDDNTNQTAEEKATIALMEGYRNIFISMYRQNLFDPSYDNNFFLRFAAMYAYNDIVEMLLMDHRVDPSAKNNEALYEACISGYRDITRMLINDYRVNPAFQDYKCLKTALKYKHELIFRDIILNRRFDLKEFYKYALETQNIVLLKGLLKTKRIKFSGLNGYKTIVCTEEERKLINRLVGEYY